MSERRCEAVLVVGRPLVFFIVPGGVEHRAGFDEGDVDAELRENLYHGSAAGAGTDYDDVKDGSVSLHLWSGLHTAPA